MAVFGNVWGLTGGTVEPIDAPTITVEDHGDGTISIHVSGSSSGTTNTAHTRPYNASSSVGWSSAGSVAGNGSVGPVGLADGLYYAVVYSVGPEGQQTISNLEHFRVESDSTNDRFGSRRDAAFNRRGQQVIYKAFNSGSVDPRTGVVSRTYDETTITQALPSFVTEEDVSQTGGKVKLGDAVFRVRRFDCPDNPPDQRSVIVFDNVSYQVLGHRRSQDLYVWDVFAREV